MSETYWGQLDKWQRKTVKGSTWDERHPRIFCCSMSDLFEGPETCQDLDAYAVVEAGRARLFEAIKRTPNLIYLLLSKRPENMVKFAPAEWAGGWPENVWAGTSVEDQSAADTRIRALLQVPARRFLSVEPLLGPLDLGLDELMLANFFAGEKAFGAWTAGGARIDTRKKDLIHWVIVGGESGAGARPMHPNWARSLRNQCQAAAVPFMFKQWGQFSPDFDGNTGYTNVSSGGPMDTDCPMYSVGKHAAGRLLDGRTWDELPFGDAPSAGQLGQK